MTPLRDITPQGSGHKEGTESSQETHHTSENSLSIPSCPHDKGKMDFLNILSTISSTPKKYLLANSQQIFTPLLRFSKQQQWSQQQQQQTFIEHMTELLLDLIYRWNSNCLGQYGLVLMRRNKLPLSRDHPSAGIHWDIRNSRMEPGWANYWVNSVLVAWF